MIRIILGQGVNPERLAEFLSGLLGERLRYETEENMPRLLRGGKDVWQLDRAEEYWLVKEGGSMYRFMASTESGQESVRGMIDDVRTNPLVTSATVVE